ncbi:periplasmic chaperone for outer membrane proteins SurA [Trichlorobacter thiogenes]|uniref:Periplasmic chaperone for outer membrane proteins SurA n=1 Tax=Trichlorobacter thiogenes TaxID=115783 RepID=A0A1T4Q8W1_9BACT|nr:peptidylprolyl isomerase [Trichlorobacter thiogenes]SKA00193.1 periplasmic chaperone for outer membrane proteins SurA [Trichlorobacter thiogenes]
MNQLRLLIPASLLATLLLAGCASKPDVVTDTANKQPPPTLIAPKLPPLPAGAKRVNGIAAIVNDDVITFRDVLRESQPVIQDAQKKGLVDDKARHDLRVTVLDRMIDKMITDQKVKELGIKIGDDEIRQAVDDVKRQNNNMTQSQLEAALKAQGYTFSQYEGQLREQLERLRLVSMEVRSKVHVGDKEAEQYYTAHQDKYAEEETFKARHIFIKVDEKAPAAEIQQAMNKALKVLFEARQGKDFIALAKEYSDDPAAKKDGGDLGSFKKGEMLADLEKAILPLKPGEVGELVNTPSGLHIVKLDERSTGKVKSFESVKADIKELLYRQKQDERFSSWMKELRSKASIVIKDGSGII